MTLVSSLVLITVLSFGWLGSLVVTLWFSPFLAGRYLGLVLFAPTASLCRLERSAPWLACGKWISSKSWLFATDMWSTCNFWLGARDLWSPPCAWLR